MVRLHRKILGEEPMVYRGAVAAGMVVSAIVGAGSSAYQADQQRGVAKKQREELAMAEAARKAEIERVARETRPEGEVLEEIKFGIEDDELGTVSDFLVKKPTTSALSSSGGSGLGFTDV